MMISVHNHHTKTHKLIKLLYNRNTFRILTGKPTETVL